MVNVPIYTIHTDPMGMGDFLLLLLAFYMKVSAVMGVAPVIIHVIGLSMKASSCCTSNLHDLGHLHIELYVAVYIKYVYMCMCMYVYV